MKKKILVTGSHRSGTTWTGKVISKAKGSHYVHEPFNMIKKYSPLIYWFEFINNEISIEKQNRVLKYIDSFCTVINIYNVKRLIMQRSLSGLYQYSKNILNCLLSDKIILKDPIAIMSADWIYKNHNIDIVVLIRHPAAFVASLKIKDWQYDFNNYLNQSLLMKNYLKDYEKLIIDYSKNKKDIIDQGILLWNTIYDVIGNYKSKYAEEWYFVKHEDLSLHPIEEFKKLFSRIDLNFDSDVEDYIKETIKAKNYLDIEKNSTSVFNVKRNSIENIKSWKKRLSDDEIQRIKIGTEKVWKKFYSEYDW